MNHRQLLLISALLCLPGSILADGSTRVYRCTGENGKVEFRQGPCVQGQQLELEIEDQKVGWEAPTHTVEIKKRRKKTTRKSRSSSRDDVRMKEKCLKTKHRLENVSRKLRRGYKASQSDNLRRKRDQYEEYLREMCR